MDAKNMCPVTWEILLQTAQKDSSYVYICILLPKLQLFYSNQYETHIEISKMILKAQKHKTYVREMFFQNGKVNCSVPQV